MKAIFEIVLGLSSRVTLATFFDSLIEVQVVEMAVEHWWLTITHFPRARQVT